MMKHTMKQSKWWQLDVLQALAEFLHSISTDSNLVVVRVRSNICSGTQAENARAKAEEWESFESQAKSGKFLYMHE